MASTCGAKAGSLRRGCRKAAIGRGRGPRRDAPRTKLPRLPAAKPLFEVQRYTKALAGDAVEHLGGPPGGNKTVKPFGFKMSNREQVHNFGGKIWLVASRRGFEPLLAP
jgi:hypothetical protein